MKYIHSAILLILALTFSVGGSAKCFVIPAVDMRKKDKAAKTNVIANDNTKAKKQKKAKVKIKKDKINDDMVAALRESLSEVMHRHVEGGDSLAHAISVRFSGSAKMQTAIGIAYFANHEKEKAEKYFQKAIATNPSCPDPYLAYGRMFDGSEQIGYEWNADSAAHYYNKAIELDPKNPVPYKSLAMAYAYVHTDSMRLAKATLERYKAINPDFNVDVAIADLYIKAYQNDNDIVENLSKTDPNTLSEFHLGKLVVSSYWTYEYDKCAAYSKIGMERFPQNQNFGRFFARSQAQLGNYNVALDYGQKYLETLPKDSLNSVDYYTMGTAYLGTGNFEKGFENYDKIKNLKDDWSESFNKDFLFKNIRKIISLKTKEKKYDEALSLQQKLMQVYPYSEEVTGWDDLASIYMSKVNDSSIPMADRIKTLEEELVSLINKIEIASPNFTGLIYDYYFVAVSLNTLLDPETKEGKAEPYCNKLLELVSKKPLDTLTDDEKTYAAIACDLIGIYKFKGQNDMKAAIHYLQRALYYKIDDETATTTLPLLHAPVVAVAPTSTSAAAKKTVSKKKTMRRR